MTEAHHRTGKRGIAKCIACLFAVLIIVLPSSKAYATANDDAIAAAIYTHTGIQGADSDRVKHIKAEFAAATGITSATSDSAITWASIPSGGNVSAPWNGTKLNITAAVASHTPGYTELVAETVPSGNITTVTYTQYTSGASSSDSDIAKIQLVVKTDASTPDTAEYHPYTAEALAYAMGQFAEDKLGSVLLESDIDLNGQNYNWIKVSMTLGQSFDGQGHTIYNLCANNNEDDATNSRSGFVCAADLGMTFENVTFETAYIIGTHYSGIIGYLNGSSGANTLNNVRVRNVVTVISSIILRDGNAGALAGSVEADSIITNCSAENCVVFGGYYVGALAGSVMGKGGETENQARVTRCFSVGCRVFSAKEYAGGLVSYGSHVNFTDCFSDVSAYGTSDAGAFIGALNGKSSVTSCFASGFVEGQTEIGGFIGKAEYTSGGTSLTISDCYTTALVGLSSGGTRLGGFIGFSDDRTLTCSFVNCYAAGEVGSADTEVSPPSDDDYTQDQVKLCGGFIGYQALTSNYYENCYYDKQTTAMREWVAGHRASGANLTGINGVLTTDTDKSGNGLMTQTFSKAHDADFDCFTEGGNISAKWDYTAQDHYPELVAFKNADPTEWGGAEYANLAKAYSLSSTSGVQLDTWEKGLGTDTGEYTRDLPATTYCTVRDLTRSFLLTSEDGVLTTDGWKRTKTANGDGNEVAKSTIKGKEYDVLSLKNQNGRYLCDEFVPGIEWLMVTCEVDGVKATRRMRVIPTVGIEAGQSAIIAGKYDHADDVELFFSTSNRLGSDNTDITTGIYPDGDMSVDVSPLTSRQTELKGSADTSAGNNTFRDVAVQYMSLGDDNAKDGKLYLYVYPVTGVNSATGEITHGQLMSFTKPVDASSSASLGDMLNELSDFPNKDRRFLLSYAWVLNDGRVVQDSKLLRVAETPFNLQLNLYKNQLLPERLYPNGGYLYDGVAGTAKLPLTDFSGFISVASDNTPTLNAAADFKEHAQTAWQLKNPADSLQSVKLKINISDTEFYEKEVSNPTSGQTIDVPVKREKIVYLNGAYYTIPEVVNRTYTLMQDAAMKTWYLNFDMTDVSKSGFIFNDVETSIVVDVVVNSAAPDTGGLTIQNTVTGTGADINKDFSFEVRLSNAINGVYGGMTFKSGVARFTLRHGKSMSAWGLPAGTTYEVIESGSDGYSVTKSGENGIIEYEIVTPASFTNNKNAAATTTNNKDEGTTAPYTGGLKVQTTVTGTGADINKDFSFEVRLSNAINGVYGGMTFKAGVARFTLRHGKSMSAEGLPAGTAFRVTESGSDGYSVTKSGETGIIKYGIVTLASFTNKKDTGAAATNNKDEGTAAPDNGGLKVQTTATGTGADISKDFSFEVRLSDATINGVYGGMTFKAGVAKFTLKHGESMSAEGLPAGTEYEVTESGSDGYSVTKSGETGTIKHKIVSLASFANNKDTSAKATSLSVVLTSDIGTISPDRVITYTITVANNGNASATGIRVRDYIPQYTSFVAGSIAGAGAHGAANGKEHVTWNIASVAPGEVLTLSFKVKIDDFVPEDASIGNTVMYDAGGNIPTNDPLDPLGKSNTVWLTMNPSTGDSASTGSIYVYASVFCVAAIGLFATLLHTAKKKNAKGRN